VFAVLVVATVAAFFTTQQLKGEFPLVIRFAAKPKQISPNGDGYREIEILPDGTLIQPKVVAIYDRGLGFGDFTLPRGTLDGHLTDPLDHAVLVRIAGDAAPAEVDAALAGLAYAGLAVMDRAGFQAAQAEAMALADRHAPIQAEALDLLVRRGGDRLLFDCGEGTQRQLIGSPCPPSQLRSSYFSSTPHRA
jgi:hypothetical protein